MATVSRIRIGPADLGRRMTLDEFEAAEEQPGYRYELVEGVLEVSDLPRLPQRRIVTNLYRLITDFERAHPGLIDYFGGGSELRLWMRATNMGRYPDFGVVFLGAPLDTVGDPLVGLAAEVVSASSRARDYQTKRREYLAYGVLEYWIVDPYDRRVFVLARREGEAGPYWEESVFEGDDVIESEMLPGLASRVSDLWAGVAMEDL